MKETSSQLISVTSQKVVKF